MKQASKRIVLALNFLLLSMCSVKEVSKPSLIFASKEWELRISLNVRLTEWREPPPPQKTKKNLKDIWSN